MILLVTTSVISVAFIVERALALRWRRVIPPAVVNAARGCRNTGDLPALRQTCEAFPSPVARLLLVAANHLDCPRAENVDALQTKARHEVAGLERGLVVLEINRNRPAARPCRHDFRTDHALQHHGCQRPHR